MRTTLSVDDDVLLAMQELAKQQRKTAGEVISAMLREALRGRQAAPAAVSVFGFRPFPPRAGAVVTNELVEQLREEGE